MFVFVVQFRLADFVQGMVTCQFDEKAFIKAYTVCVSTLYQRVDVFCDISDSHGT